VAVLLPSPCFFCCCGGRSGGGGGGSGAGAQALALLAAAAAVAGTAVVVVLVQWTLGHLVLGRGVGVLLPSPCYCCCCGGRRGGGGGGAEIMGTGTPSGGMGVAVLLPSPRCGCGGGCSGGEGGSLDSWTWEPQHRRSAQLGVGRATVGCCTPDGSGYSWSGSRPGWRAPSRRDDRRARAGRSGDEGGGRVALLSPLAFGFITGERSPSMKVWRGGKCWER
jgi:hypothetical protein